MRQGVAVVVAAEQRLLMIRRATGILAGGAWCFVGGGLETGESQEAAVVREFSEEVGGLVTPVRKVWEYHHPNGELQLHWWFARLIQPPTRPNPEEVAELRWCTLDEVGALPGLLASNLQFLREVNVAALLDA